MLHIYFHEIRFLDALIFFQTRTVFTFSRQVSFVNECLSPYIHSVVCIFTGVCIFPFSCNVFLFCFVLFCVVLCCVVLFFVQSRKLQLKLQNLIVKIFVSRNLNKNILFKDVHKFIIHIRTQKMLLNFKHQELLLNLAIQYF